MTDMNFEPPEPGIIEKWLVGTMFTLLFIVVAAVSYAIVESWMAIVVFAAIILIPMVVGHIVTSVGDAW
jgi:hypothetical protein